MRPIVIAAVLTVLATPAIAQQSVRSLTLEEAVALAQDRGHAAEGARQARDAARYRASAFNARLLPQLRFVSDPVDLQRGTTPVITQSGTEYYRLSQNRSTAGLEIAQPLPWLGAELTIGSRMERIDQYGDDASRRWNSNPFVVGLRQDLFRPRLLRWQQKEEELGASIAERRWLETREDIALATSNAYFDLYGAQTGLDNAVANAAVNDTLYTLNKGRFDVGKIGENDLLQSELALLRTRGQADGARVERDRAEAALKRLTGLTGPERLAVVPPAQTAPVTVDAELAVQQARKNASTIEEGELETVRAGRELSIAKSRRRGGAAVSAEVGYNQTATDFSAAYQSPLSEQRARVQVEMPLVQWGAGRAEVQAARADQARAVSTAQARREQLEEDARFGALQLMQTQRMLAISAKADTVAQKRFEVAKNRYVIGKIGISDLYIAQSEKDQAVVQYIQALRGYWAAHYRLRRTTLYDFSAGREIR